MDTALSSTGATLGAWWPWYSVPFIEVAEPSVIIVMLEYMGEGRMLSWNVVSDAHCQATDSLVRERQAELCCWGIRMGTAKGPRAIEPISWVVEKLSLTDSVLTLRSLRCTVSLYWT